MNSWGIIWVTFSSFFIFTGFRMYRFSSGRTARMDGIDITRWIDVYERVGCNAGTKVSFFNS